jgi:hypothetical protein
MAIFDKGVDLAGEQIDSGQKCPMARVIVIGRETLGANKHASSAGSVRDLAIALSLTTTSSSIANANPRRHAIMTFDLVSRINYKPGDKVSPSRGIAAK